MTAAELLVAIEEHEGGVSGLVRSGLAAEDLPDDETLRDYWAKVESLVSDAAGPRPHSRVHDRLAAWEARVVSLLEGMA